MSQYPIPNTQYRMTDDLNTLVDELNAPLNPNFKCGYVAVVGKPNVGKSAIVNALVGHRVAITSPKAQTTRRRVLGIFSDADKQVLFMDTPGIHQPKRELGKFMMRQVEMALSDADVILFVADVTRPPGDEDRRVIEEIHQSDRSASGQTAQPGSKPILYVLNKIDAVNPAELLENVRQYEELTGKPLAALSGPPDANTLLTTSATRGDNLQTLMALIVDKLPHGPAFYPPEQYTDQNDRIMAAELVREQALRFLSQEVPHSVAVSVDEFKERRRGPFYIGATIFVERDSQKGILIGKGGEMLRKIGMEARKEIERDLDHPVFLELWVKVRDDWRSNPGAIESLMGG